MLNNMSRSEKILLIILGVVIVLFIYVRFLFTPIINSISDERNIITDYNKQVQRINDTKSKNNVLKTKIASLQDKMDKNSDALPYSERTPELERNIKPMMDKEKIVFSSISLGQASAVQSVNNGQTSNSGSQNTGNQQAQSGINKGSISLMSQPMSFACMGEYSDIIKLVDDIEKDKRLAQVDSVSLSPSGSSVQANISLRYYFISTAKQQEINYGFTDGKYGKDNLFK